MSTLKLEDFDYNLPLDLIAQNPIIPKDHSKLLILNKKNGEIIHKHFFDLPELIEENTVLVMNNTKVIPARLFGKKNTGASIELLLIKNISAYNWMCFCKPAKRLNINTVINILKKDGTFSDLKAEVISKKDENIEIKFNREKTELLASLNDYGCLALPPYIKAKLEKDEYYQTCYAKKEGSIAAPTAGLHFTPNLFKKLAKKNIKIEFIELQVGPGTFLPVKESKIEDHKMHSEVIIVDKNTADRLNNYKKEKRKIYVVGTTTCRALESATNEKGFVEAFDSETDIFIYPGYKFKFVENLITNFHLPKSTLLMLISALAGNENIKKAYREAIEMEYRFYSFGDAMMIR